MIYWAKYFSEQMCSALDRNPLNTSIVMFEQMLECGFIWKFVITGLRYTTKSQELLKLLLIVTSKTLSYLLSFSHSIIYCICGPWLLRTFKHSVGSYLLLNQTWESLAYRQNVLGARPNVKANSVACFLRFCK